jgi:hypothetical protein
MKNKSWLLLIIVGIIAFIAVVIVYYVVKDFPSDEEVPVINDQGIIPPSATGDISELEDALDKELADEDILINEESFDSDLIESDNVEIDNFGQSVNENDL